MHLLGLTGQDDLAERTIPADAGGYQLPALVPGGHLDQEPKGDDQREPSALGELGDVGRQKGAVDEQERGDDEGDLDP